MVSFLSRRSVLQRRWRRRRQTQDPIGDKNPGVPVGQDQPLQEADDQLPHPAEHHPQVQVLLQVLDGQQPRSCQRNKGAGTWLICGLRLLAPSKKSC